MMSRWIKESLIDSMNYRESSITREVWISRLFLLGAFVFCYGWVFMALAREWWSNDIYSHGFLIPFISGYLVWVRRERLARLPLDPSYIGGLFVLSAGLLMLFMGSVGRVTVLAEISLIVTICGMILLRCGRQVLLNVAAPVVYLFFMIPIWGIFLTRLYFPFQISSATIGVTLLRFFQVPVYHDGIYLHMPNIILEVAKECSGINYLISVVAIGLPMSVLFLNNNKKRVFLICFAVAVAIFGNGLRIALIGALSFYGFDGALHGPLHMLQGLSVAIMGYAALFAGTAFLSRNSVTAPLLENAGPSGDLFRSNSEKKRGKVITVSIALLFLLAGSYIQLQRPGSVSLKHDLTRFPFKIGEWLGSDAAPVFKSPRADHEISRVYRTDAGEGLYLYIGYYESQEQGKKVVGEETRALEHEAEPLALRIGPGREFIVNKVIQREKGRERIVLFWYDLDGRVVMNQYWAKAHTMWDAVIRDRTHGAVVVLASDWMPSVSPEMLNFSQTFLRELFPLVHEYLPSEAADRI